MGVEARLDNLNRRNTRLLKPVVPTPQGKTMPRSDPSAEWDGTGPVRVTFHQSHPFHLGGHASHCWKGSIAVRFLARIFVVKTHAHVCTVLSIRWGTGIVLIFSTFPNHSAHFRCGTGWALAGRTEYGQIGAPTAFPNRKYMLFRWKYVGSE